MKLRSLIVIPVLLLALVACGDDDDTATSDPATSDAAEAGAAGATDVRVVASTTWTGALARLAGASDIVVIAPTSVLHPPDYDPRPSDLAAAADADLVVYAEFESFATRLTEAAGADASLFPLTLENTAVSIEAEVLRLAEELGTTAQAQANLDELLPQLAELGADAASHVGDAPPVVVAQLFMAYWADWAGLTTAGTFGPAAMSADDLASLLDMAPTLVFDNHHIPGGQALEAEGIARIELINYPGEDLDLLPVFQHNHDLIVAALGGEITADPDVSVPAAEAGTHDHSDSTATEHDHSDAATEEHDHTTTTVAHDHG